MNNSLANDKRKREIGFYLSPMLRFISQGLLTGSDRYALKDTHASLSDSLSNNFLKGGGGAWSQYKRKCNGRFTSLNKTYHSKKKMYWRQLSIWNETPEFLL